MKVELTKEQVEATIQILERSQINGALAEFMVKLKNAFRSALIKPTEEEVEKVK